MTACRPRAASWHVWAWACGLALIAAGPLDAQGRAGARNAVPTVEVAGGVSWSRGADLGTADAVLRANSTISSPYAVFASRTRLDGTVGVEARVAVAVQRRLAIEARGSVSHPAIATTVSGDIEGAPGVTATDRLDAYRFDGSAVYHLPGWRVAGATPFVTAGAGYLRLRHEGRLLIEDKFTYHAGAGVRRTVWDAPRGVITSLALVGDARLLVVPDGLTASGRRVRTVAASVMLAAGF